MKAFLVREGRLLLVREAEGEQCWECRHTRGEIVLSAEHVEFRWVTKADCASLDLAPGYAAALEQFWLT
ncbi:MAG TPA: hypothetical protein VE755_06365 [Myxococcales bacterium]|jgi:hypothetical protein|nr:hypothetical protein [Myxococcales bacterium]